MRDPFRDINVSRTFHFLISFFTHAHACAGNARQDAACRGKIIYRIKRFNHIRYVGKQPFQ